MSTKKIYHELQKRGQIFYGNTLHPEVLFLLIGHNLEDGWNFLGPYLSLKEEIESHGYFCSSSGCKPGGLLILPLEIMSERADQIQKNILKRQGKLAKTMKNCSFENLSIESRKKHWHCMNKINYILNGIKDFHGRLCAIEERNRGK